MNVSESFWAVCCLTAMELDFTEMFGEDVPGHELQPAASGADAARELVASSGAAESVAESIRCMPRHLCTSKAKSDSIRRKQSFTRKGKLGFDPRASKEQARALAYYRLFCKTRKHAILNEANVLDLLLGLESRTARARQSFQVVRGKGPAKCWKLVMSAQVKSVRGNRGTRAYGPSRFLEVCWGEVADSQGPDEKNRFSKVHDVAKHFGMSRTHVGRMIITTAAAVMSKQIYMLSQMLLLCRKEAPDLAASRLSFDETVQDISLHLEQASKSSRSAWQIMVAKLRLMLTWGDKTLDFNIDAWRVWAKLGIRAVLWFSGVRFIFRV
mgnify:CR=1 FL=1